MLQLWLAECFSQDKHLHTDLFTYNCQKGLVYIKTFWRLSVFFKVINLDPHSSLIIPNHIKEIF